MKKRIALLLVALFALAGWPGAGLATPAGDEVTILENTGRMSNENINHSVIDLVYVSSGTVTAYTYMGTAETLTVDSFSVLAQDNASATNKITRFVFELTNRYRPETTLPVSVSLDKNTVHAYTYGTMKDEAMWAVVNGLPDCLGNPPITGGGSGGGGDSSWIDQYSPGQIAETIATATFAIDSTTLTVSNASTSETKTVEMDVAPEVINDRTYVPVRYLAYALGVPEEGVKWDGVTETVTITYGDTAVGLTIGSTTQIVNGKPVAMDVAPYVKEIKTGGRTMLPARWIAEPLGATVTWDQEQQQMKIEIPQSQET